MAMIKYNGKEVPVAEDWRLSELIEAENALDLDMETARASGKTALIIYISMRRVDRETGRDQLGREVMALDLSALNIDTDVETADPLDDADGQTKDEQGNDWETAVLPIGGLPPSDS